MKMRVHERCKWVSGTTFLRKTENILPLDAAIAQDFFFLEKLQIYAPSFANINY
jgi:hypothetical protein